MCSRGMRVHIDKILILEALHLKGLDAEIVNAWSNKHEHKRSTILNPARLSSVG